MADDASNIGKYSQLAIKLEMPLRGLFSGTFFVKFIQVLTIYVKLIWNQKYIFGSMINIERTLIRTKVHLQLTMKGTIWFENVGTKKVERECNKQNVEKNTEKVKEKK